MNEGRWTNKKVSFNEVTRLHLIGFFRIFFSLKVVHGPMSIKGDDQLSCYHCKNGPWKCVCNLRVIVQDLCTQRKGK